HITETVDWYRCINGRSAFQGRRSMTVWTCGAMGGEHAGVSSEGRVGSPSTEGRRHTGEGASALGQSGPKPRQACEEEGAEAEMRRRWATGRNSGTGAVRLSDVVTQ